MTTIRVSCTDQVMRLVERPTLASGGVNEAVVKFDFCEKWDGFAKTAVFYRDEEQLYPMLLENDSCFIPWEVYSTPGTFYFTVFGVKEEIRKTANTLRYKATKGIPDGEMIPSEPTQEMYEQIIDRLDKLEQNGTGGGVSEEQITEAVNEALEEAKASGEFDGADGYTPVKGVDYFDGKDGADYVLTEADKTEIAEQAAQMVEVPEGGTVTDEQIADAVEDYMAEHPVEVPNVDLSGYAKSEDIPTDEHINELIDTALEDFDVPSGGSGVNYHITELTTTEEVEKIKIPLKNYEDTELFLRVKTGSSTFKFSWGVNFPRIGNSKYTSYGSAITDTAQYEIQYYFRILHKSDSDNRHMYVQKKNAIVSWNGPYWTEDAEDYFCLDASTSGETFPIGTVVQLIEVYR